jgi:microcystin-dependent protein
MAITKSYSFTTGTTIDPDEVNQNFDDVLDEIKGDHHSDADGTPIDPDDIHEDWGLVPVGGIILWSGTISNIPSGYSFCNGSSGTVDLRNKFTLCPGQDSGGTYDTSDTGGSATHTLTTAQIPSHSHKVDPPITNTSSHTHTVDPPATNTGGQSASHTHTVGGSFWENVGGGSATHDVGSDNINAKSTVIVTGGANSNHHHTVNIAQFNSGSTGSGSSHNNMPPYKAVVYIQLTG